MKNRRLRKRVNRFLHGGTDHPDIRPGGHRTEHGADSGDAFPNTVKLSSVNLTQLLQDGTLSLN